MFGKLPVNVFTYDEFRVVADREACCSLGKASQIQCDKENSKTLFKAHKFRNKEGLNSGGYNCVFNSYKSRKNYLSHK